jgi:fatty acid desaturase
MSALNQNDLSGQRNEFLFTPPLSRLLISALKDPRDWPMLFLFANIAMLSVPGALLVLFSRSHAVGFLFWMLNLVLFQERFLLALHFHSHRPIFKSKALNATVSLVFPVLFGLPSGLYHLHHVIMHHSENNRDGWDLSSTERYQRDSVLHFLMYWLRFLCLIWFELPAYALKKKRTRLALQSSAAVVLFFLVTYILWHVNRPAAVWLIIVPTFVNSLLLMLGNWSQHIFVDPSNPRSNYHIAYNVINDSCNQRTFNDGYHIEHHLNPRTHWSELPSNFAKNVETYVREDALVFQGVDFIRIGLLVFSQRYDILSKHLVQLNQRTEAEIEAMLRARLAAFVCKKLRSC